jgi:hypothetical protein
MAIVTIFLRVSIARHEPIFHLSVSFQISVRYLLFRDKMLLVCENVDWVNLAQNTVQRWDLLNIKITVSGM